MKKNAWLIITLSFFTDVWSSVHVYLYKKKLLFEISVKDLHVYINEILRIIRIVVRVFHEPQQLSNLCLKCMHRVMVEDNLRKTFDCKHTLKPV